MALPQCCYLAKGAKRPSYTTNTIKFDRIPFDPCNSIKRFDLCPFDQKNSTYLQPPPISSSAPRPLGAAYVPILLSEVEQEQRSSGNGDCEAIVVGAGLCDGEGERAYIGYASQYIFAFEKGFCRCRQLPCPLCRISMPTLPKKIRQNGQGRDTLPNSAFRSPGFPFASLSRTSRLVASSNLFRHFLPFSEPPGSFTLAGAHSSFHRNSKTSAAKMELRPPTCSYN